MCAFLYSSSFPTASTTRFGSFKCSASHTVETSIVFLSPCPPHCPGAAPAGTPIIASKINPQITARNFLISFLPKFLPSLLIPIAAQSVDQFALRAWPAHNTPPTPPAQTPARLPQTSADPSV